MELDIEPELHRVQAQTNVAVTKASAYPFVHRLLRLLLYSFIGQTSTTPCDRARGIRQQSDRMVEIVRVENGEPCDGELGRHECAGLVTDTCPFGVPNLDRHPGGPHPRAVPAQVRIVRMRTVTDRDTRLLVIGNIPVADGDERGERRDTPKVTGAACTANLCTHIAEGRLAISPPTSRLPEHLKVAGHSRPGLSLASATERNSVC